MCIILTVSLTNGQLRCRGDDEIDEQQIQRLRRRQEARAIGSTVLMKDMSKALNNIVMVGQLGLSLIMPILLCMAACWFLTSRFGLGTWVYLPGFILGIGSSFMTAYKVYLAEVNRNKKEDGKKRTAFNRHY